MALKTPVALNPSTFAVPSLSAASTSDTFATPSGDNQAFAVYRNTGASTTLTVVVPGNDVFGRAISDIAVTLPATTGELWIPLYTEMGDSTGVITITLLSATGVTNAHVRIA